MFIVPEEAQGARKPVISLGRYVSTANSARQPNQMFGRSQYTQHTSGLGRLRHNITDSSSTILGVTYSTLRARIRLVGLMLL